MIQIKTPRHTFENPIIIEKEEYLPGDKGTVRLVVGRTPSDSRIYINAHIYRAKKPGPCILIMGGVHGDEINGIEIVSQLVLEEAFENIDKGTIIAIPLLNVFGFNNFSRDVSDGKDVNRSFPGTITGSQASRVARMLSKNFLQYVDYAMDYHTGGESRYNYPQVRYTKSDKISFQMAEEFNAPFTIQQPLISKSFRKISKDLGISTIVFEGGESVRLCGVSIQKGKEGAIRVLEGLEILKNNDTNKIKHENIHIIKTAWIRAQYSGIFVWSKSSGNYVEKGEPIGVIRDPYGTKKIVVLSKYTGHIIGHNNASVVNQGDALFHIGFTDDTESKNTTF